MTMQRRCVCSLVTVPHVLRVDPRENAKTVAEFAAAMKAKPDGYNHGSSGVGSTLNLEQFAELNRSEFDRYGKLVKAANIKAE
jgi:tripartite-type tricarboxylate transporter receptor subunit TctC